MTFCEFQTTTYGKWILAGEHAVIRGHSALVFPLHEKKLKLRFKPSVNPLTIHCTPSVLQQLLSTAINQGKILLNLPLNVLTGVLEVDCNIPIGVGMGASAAVCVAIARWFEAQGLLTDPIMTFAKNLEDHFHGKSSGLDIAGVASETGIFFNQGRMRAMHLAWQPSWTLSYSGCQGLTSHCVQQVVKLWQQNRELAEAIDFRMQAAVVKAKKALEVEEIASFFSLKEAIQESLTCFQDWGLVNQNLNHHMNQLLTFGAIAVKPTGSGGGGYVLSLWNEEPPLLPFDLIRAQQIDNKPHCP